MPWRASVVPALILVAGAFAVVLAGVDSQVFDLERYLEPKSLDLHLTALALLLIVPSRLRLGSREPVAVLLVAFVALGALSALAAVNRWLALEAWGISFSGMILFLTARRLPAEARRFVLAGVLSAVVLGAGLGVAQAYGLQWTLLAEARPPGGTFGNRNFLAHFAALGAPPLLALAVGVRGRGWRLLTLGGLAVLVAAVVLTRSRGAWLGTAAGLGVTAVALVLGVRRRHRAHASGDDAPWWRPGRTAVTVLTLVVAAGVAVALPNRLQWNSETPYAGTLSRIVDFREGSGRGRIIQYGNSLELVADAPVLGVGPGNWFVHYPRVTEDGDPSFAGHLAIPTNPWPSSDWVAFLTERGALATVLLLGAGLILFLQGARAALTGATAEEEHAGAALAGLLAATLVTGAFDAVLLLAAPTYMVAVTAGSLATGRESAAGHEDRRSWLRWIPIVIAAALTVVAGLHTLAIATTAEGRDTGTLLRAARLAPGEHRLQLLLAERGRCDHARKAARLMPYHPGVKSLLEDCSP